MVALAIALQSGQVLSDDLNEARDKALMQSVLLYVALDLLDFRHAVPGGREQQ